MRRHIYGHDHPISAMTLTASSRAYLVNQQPLVAELQLREALCIQQLTLPENHSDKAITLNVLGNVAQQRGNLQEAVSLLDYSLEIRTAVFNSDHQDIGYCKHDLAMALLRSGRADCAIPLLQDALRIKCQKFGNHHIEVAITYGCLAEAYKAIGDCKQSKTYLDNRTEIMNQ
ncbi:nephrocystin-3-like [Corticium candelabrum]|uniref:nephrocystin-3-like n=1 Tax=Corticium candelabrum TaxID=121492 RepID=UPI002E25305C|nr:nephrocystin-3-like [Corticium candelabrum]